MIHYLVNNLNFKRLSILILGLFFSYSIMAQQNDSTQVLDGKITRADIENFNWFKENYVQYKPAMSVVNELSEFKKCSLLVVLGTWCSDSHELVPQLFKVMDLAGWDNVELIAVDEKKQSKSVDVKPLNIEYVPIIILFNDKHIVGKIVETTATTIEEDLLMLLKK